MLRFMIVVLFLSSPVFAVFEIKEDQVISIEKDGERRILFNLYPHLKFFKFHDDNVKKTLLLESIKNYISSSQFKKNSKKIEVKVVLIKNLDEYARPNFSEMSNIGQLNFHYKDDILTLEKEELNLNLFHKELENIK